MLLIGVSTEQNTSNLIPAIQTGADQVLLIETARAWAENWSIGLNKVLATKGIQILDPVKLSQEESSRIDIIIQKLTDRIPVKDPVIWCLGGGQKPQQLATWQVFITRNQNGIADQACYANPESRQLETWRFDDGHLRLFTSPLETDLTADEIVTTFGYALKIKHDSRFLYSTLKDNAAKEVQFTDFYSNSEFREWLYLIYQSSDKFRSDKLTADEFNLFLKSNKPAINKSLQALFEKFKPQLLQASSTDSLVKSIKNQFLGSLGKWISDSLLTEIRAQTSIEEFKISDPALISWLGQSVLKSTLEEFKKLTLFDRQADYYETAVVHRFQTLLNQQKPHWVSECYSNVEFIPISGSQTASAEIDILVVTKTGQLISVDAKSYDFVKKDADARTLNLQKAGGKLGKVIAVIPWFRDDIDKISSKQKLIPFTLKNSKIPFYTFTNDTETTTLWQVGESNISLEPIQGKPSVSLRPLDQFFKEEKLLTILA